MHIWNHVRINIQQSHNLLPNGTRFVHLNAASLSHIGNRSSNGLSL